MLFSFVLRQCFLFWNTILQTSNMFCIYMFVSSFVFLLTSADTHSLIHGIAFSLKFGLCLYWENVRNISFEIFPIYIFVIIPSSYSIILTNTIKADWIYQGNYKYLATFPDLISPSSMQYLFIHSSCVSSRV